MTDTFQKILTEMLAHHENPLVKLYASRLAALSQPGEVTEGQLAAAKKAYDAARYGGFRAEHGAMRAALTAALSAQTRGEGATVKESLTNADGYKLAGWREIPGGCEIYPTRSEAYLLYGDDIEPIYVPDQQKGAGDEDNQRRAAA